jgi:hypothetical protein
VTEQDVLSVLEPLRERLQREAKVQSDARRYNGVGAWWEQSGFAGIVDTAIGSVRRHARRARRGRESRPDTAPIPPGSESALFVKRFVTSETGGSPWHA